MIVGTVEIKTQMGQLVSMLTLADISAEQYTDVCEKTVTASILLSMFVYFLMFQT